MTATATAAAEHIVIVRVGWDFYQRMLTELGDSSSPRLAYDGEILEIMAPSKAHESYARLVDRLLQFYAPQKRLKIENVGSTTLQWKPRGAEPDSTYYIANAMAILGKEKLDLAVDPPPDLVLEVDISRSRIDKVEIYSSMRIPEFWRYIEDTLHAYALIGDVYTEIQVSNVLPGLMLADVNRFMEMRHTTDQTAIAALWLTWLETNERP